MSATTALATVPQDSCVTLGDPTTMTNKELVAVAIQAFSKIQPYVPYIVELKGRFEAGERDSLNRLREPIEGCHSWKEFCTSILNRNYESIRAALAAAKNPKSPPRQLTDADVAAYEQEHPDIRSLTEKLLKQMTAADAVGALISMETPPQIAEALVRSIVAENSESPVADTTPESENKNGIFNLLSTVQKAVRRNDEREALLAAWQLDAATGIGFKSSKGHAGGLWSVLRRICAEDIGLANPAIMEPIERLWRFWEKQTEADSKHEPWRLFTTEAVMLLCQSPKSRRVDHACIVLSGRVEKIVEELRATPQPHPIPEYAHDGRHTGTKNGKTLADFVLGEDAALSPKAEDIEDPYQAEILMAINGVAQPKEYEHDDTVI